MATLFVFGKHVTSIGTRFSIIRAMSAAETTVGPAAAITEDIRAMRIKYKDKKETFLESDLVSKEPLGQFKAWFDEACKTPNVHEANAMCLATASKDGVPSARYVLLKEYGKDGFKFFTNFSSRKGKDLEENPRAALTFYWEALKRSVRVEGAVEKLPVEESDEYFHSRPRESQIGACASQQSSVIAGREQLTKNVEELTAQFADKTIPRPQQWGGYKVIPHCVEFWQGQSDRVHDRIRFRKTADKPNEVTTFAGVDGWVYERLSP